MAHLFNKTEYLEFRTKFYPQIKKSLQLNIDHISNNLTGELHPIEGLQQTIIDHSNFNLVYEGQNLVLPKVLLEIEDFSSILNMENFKECFDESEINQLLELVPGNNMKNLEWALTGQNIHQSHLRQFQRKTKSGYFSVLRQKEDQITDKLNQCRLKQIYQQLFEKIIRKRQSKIPCDAKFQVKDEVSELQSLQDLQSMCQFSDNSQATESQEQVEEKQEEEFPKELLFKYDYSKLKTQEQMLALAEQKREKISNITYKTTLPCRPKNAEWVDSYRKQQLQRYLNPTKPWAYTCQDNRKVTVAPVAKKISVLTGKPRDHPMLKSERPACVTILTLVRDAAARLPNGVGTRADICELLKESQYINESLPEDKVSNIVSGALDRLHYMSDACVKYDSEKKLWIYLHIDRSNEHPGWGQDGDQYTEKSKKKKKVE